VDEAVSQIDDDIENYGLDRHDEGDEPRSNECRRCGKNGLTWEQDGERWVLLDHHGEIHRCDPARITKLAAADFDKLD